MLRNYQDSIIWQHGCSHQKEENSFYLQKTCIAFSTVEKQSLHFFFTIFNTHNNEVPIKITMSCEEHTSFSNAILINQLHLRADSNLPFNLLIQLKW